MSEQEETNAPEWRIVEHAWSDTSIYEGDRIVCQLSIRDEATEETQSALEKRMDLDARKIVAARQMLEVLQDFVENTDVPERNCSCHLSPPCSDCVEHGGTRDLLEAARAAIAKATNPEGK